jgi:hypothetical protein
MMYTRYRPRDWDYLGFRYSFLSSIATAGWNNVVDMIPARDPEEVRYFSAADKKWIRTWLEWAVKNKEYLRHTRTILQQPALGNVDGTAAIEGDRGYLFLFNPNYRQLPADFVLDESIGLASGETYQLKEIYPFPGRAHGQARCGVWHRGDRVHLVLDGTSATVLELAPAASSGIPILFNAAALSADAPPVAALDGTSLTLKHVAGEPGTTQTIGILLPRAARISSLTVNGKTQPFTQTEKYVETEVQFEGDRFGQAQKVTVTRGTDGALTGIFEVPQRILNQLATRRQQWPIHWTQEDYESTWLVPERLLLFVQAVDAKDSASVMATLDDKPLAFQPAYSSSRVDSSSFVGFYTDLSRIAPDARHTIKVRIAGPDPAQVQGIFFDNVEPELTESVRP